MLILYVLLGGFTVWMAIDAYRRQAGLFWLSIIVLLAPFGAFIYLFVVKLREPAVEARPSLPSGPPPPPPSPPPMSLMELRQLAAETPSQKNLLAYAEAALQHKQLDKAEETFRKVLDKDPNCRDALHGLALALLEKNSTDEAVDLLSRLMDLDFGFRDYAAAVDYAEALWLDGDHELALDVLREIVKRSPRLPHRLLLANYLALDGQKDEAREQLRIALKEYAESPPFVRRRDMDSAKAAENLLGELG